MSARLAVLLCLLCTPLAAAPDASFFGKVLADDFMGNHSPLAGATVGAFQEGVSLSAEISTLSLADGSYNLAGLEGASSYTLIISAPNMAQLQTSGLSTTAGAATPLDLVLNPGSGLYGKVTDSSGASVPGAMVEAYRNGINNSGPGQDYTSTAADGSYAFNNLSLGVWFLRVRKTGFAYATASALTLSASPVRVYRNLGGEQYIQSWHAPYLDPVVAAAWQDIDSDGLPDIVAAIQGGGSRVYKNTGGFNFVLLNGPASTANTQTLICYDYDADGRTDMILASPSEPLQVLHDINPFGCYCGYFYSPPCFTQVWKSPFDDYVAALDRADADLDGKIDLLSGTFTQLSPTVNLALGPGGSLGGMIKDALWGLGIAGATVQAQNGGATFIVGTTGSDGSYVFPNLEPSAYTLSVSAPAYLSVSASGIWVYDQAASEWNLSLTPTGAVEGKVWDGTGTPLLGAALRVQPLGLTGSSAADGSFQFTSLPAGSFTLLADYSGFPQAGRPFSIAGASPVWLSLTFSASVSGLQGFLRAKGTSAPIFGGSLVALQTDGSGYGSAQSRADGKFLMTPLAAGAYSIGVTAPGFRPASFTAAALAGSRPDLELYLEKSGAYADLSKIAVYPNPARLKLAVRHTVKFAGLPAGCTITIYSQAGYMVRTMPAGFYSGATINDGVSGMAEWAGTNDLEEPVAAGLYFYRIVSPEGRETRGKLALIK